MPSRAATLALMTRKLAFLILTRSIDRMNFKYVWRKFPTVGLLVMVAEYFLIRKMAGATLWEWRQFRDPGNENKLSKSLDNG